MGHQPRLTVTGVVLGSPDARELAAFYRRLLGWQTGADEPDWVTLRSPDGGAGLSFQTEDDYARPAWPAGAGEALSGSSASSRSPTRGARGPSSGAGGTSGTEGCSFGAPGRSSVCANCCRSKFSSACISANYCAT